VTHITHCSFDYLLDLDVISFNALLEAATKLDASRWMQTAWAHRAAAHCDQDGFKKFVKGTWGDRADANDAPAGKGIKDLIREIGSI
jgi:hypothetical protein